MSPQAREVSALVKKSSRPRASSDPEIKIAVLDECLLATQTIHENSIKAARVPSKKDQLSQSQKMASVGQMTGGIAHDFNNLLTVILGYGQMVLDDLEPGSELKARIEPMVECSKRAASLAQQLLAFSRGQVVETKIVALNNVINNIEKLLRCILGGDIELIGIYQKDLGPIKAAPGQIEQIVMNLALNARDAMPRGGKLIIETKNVFLYENFLKAELTSGNYVLLSMTDNGSGMPPEIRNRIFEPFFTTKEIGKGTGLGLSNVFNIVKQNNGHIEVLSAAGEGSCFQLYFPFCEEKIVPLSEPLTAQKDLVKAQGRILVVEDDDSVRMLACAILKKGGYEVLDTRDPKQALEMVKNLPTKIDLLLSDMIMPHMKGHQLAEEVCGIDPNIQVLFMSGLADDEGPQILPKPFSPASLLLKIKSILSAAQVEL